MGDEADSGTGMAGGERDEHWGLCSAFGCLLPGTLKRCDAWVCFCHHEADAGANDAVTRIVRSHRAVYTATLDVRAWIGSDRWPRVYRSVQERLLEAGHAGLLPCSLDASPYRPGRPIVQQWLARLERFLLDAVRDGLRRLSVQANPGTSGPKQTRPSSRECVARMRATLASLAKCEPSVKWAFELLDGIAAKPANAPPPEAVRTALDAIRSSAGRAYIANATDEQRGRWRAALDALGGTAAGLVPSREPGADDEPITELEENHDCV